MILWKIISYLYLLGFICVVSFFLCTIIIISKFGKSVFFFFYGNSVWSRFLIRAPDFSRFLLEVLHSLLATVIPHYIWICSEGIPVDGFKGFCILEAATPDKFFFSNPDISTIGYLIRLIRLRYQANYSAHSYFSIWFLFGDTYCAQARRSTYQRGERAFGVYSSIEEAGTLKRKVSQVQFNAEHSSGTVPAQHSADFPSSSWPPRTLSYTTIRYHTILRTRSRKVPLLRFVPRGQCLLTAIEPREPSFGNCSRKCL